jgi:uncharacterized membrane protein YkoI
VTTRDFFGVLAIALIAGAAGGGAAMLAGGDRADEHEGAESAANASDAKITRDSATVIALASVPGGAVKGVELEDEDGTLIYSFDIAVAGKEGVEEVHVSALDGRVTSHEHESAGDEAAEQAKESKEGGEQPGSAPPSGTKPPI